MSVYQKSTCTTVTLLPTQAMPEMPEILGRVSLVIFEKFGKNLAALGHAISFGVTTMTTGNTPACTITVEQGYMKKLVKQNHKTVHVVDSKC